MSYMKNFAYEQAQATKAARVAALVAQYPALVALSGDNCNSLTTAAKNIRIELKAAFPSIKFSVKTKRFSMGDSIDVSWTDGPAASQVEAIIGKYKEGYFDGQTDCYEYVASAWKSAFGDTMFLHASRKISPELFDRVEARVRAKLGIPADVQDGPDTYRKFGLHIGAEVSVAARRHTCAIAQTLFTEDNSGPSPSVIPVLSIVKS